MTLSPKNKRALIDYRMKRAEETMRTAHNTIMDGELHSAQRII